MRYLIVFLALSFVLDSATAQKHDYIWLFGPNYGNYIMDFNQYPPKLDRKKIDYYFHALNDMIISDVDGHLDFYSNGCNIRNRHDQVMENGAEFNDDEIYQLYCGTGNNYPTAKGLMALPAAGGYTLFYVRFRFPTDTCVYSGYLMAGISMAHNTGLGKVVWKDSFLLRDACIQDASATKHANGRDWWILIGNNREPLYYRFLYEPDKGIQGPWMQRIANPTLHQYWYNGWSCFSPDGTKYVNMMNYKGTAFYDFDRCTGLLSNMRFVQGMPGSYNTPTLVFSPDSRYLYRTWDEGATIIQYDTEAKDIGASGQTVTPSVPWIYHAMRMGPDGKIYISCGSLDSCFSVLHFPNRRGKSCEVTSRSILFPKKGIHAGQIYYPNYRLGPIDGSPCDTLGIDNLPEALWRHDIEDTLRPLRVTFTDLSYYEPSEWHWTFGDGAVSRDTSPVHTYARAGTYRVCLVVKNQNASDTLCREITVGLSAAQEPLAVGPGVQVVPNPFDATLRVLLPAEAEGARLHFSLFDALGRPVRETRLSGSETEIATAGLPPGLYFWVVRRNGREWQRGRVGKF